MRAKIYLFLLFTNVLLAGSCVGSPVSFIFVDGESDEAAELADDAGDVYTDKDEKEELPPPQTWIMRILGIDAQAYGRFITETSDGGIAFVGVWRGGGFGETDVWVVKLSGGGEPEWQKVIGGSRMEWMADIKQTENGDLLLVGWTESFERNGDGWLVRMDSAGNILWQKTIGSFQSDRLDSVHETPEGNLIIGGGTEGNMYVAVLDGNGNIQWQKSYAGERTCLVHKIVISANGDFIIAGKTNREGFELARLDHSGELLWYKSILTGTGTVYNLGLIETTNGDIVLGADSTFLRMDGNGNVIWQRTASASVYMLLEMEDRGLIFTGGDMRFGGIWLGKLDYRGTMVWQKVIENDCLEVGTDLAISEDRSVIAMSVGCDFSHIVKIGWNGEFYRYCSRILDASFIVEPGSVTLSTPSVTVENPELLSQDSNASIMDSTSRQSFICPE